MRILDSLGNRFTGRDDLSDQYRRYSETLLWVVDELVRFDKKKTYLAISSNVLGGLLKAGALVLLLYYANLMERSADISLFDLSWSSRSETVFYISITIALVFLIFGSLAVYLGSHLNNSLSINFAAHCSKMLMCASGGRPARNPDPARERYHGSVRDGVTNITLLARGVKPVLQMSNPLTTLIYGLVILLYLNSLVTLVVLLLAITSLVFQYKVNFKSAQNEREFVEGRREGNKWLGGLFGNLVMTPRIYPSRMESIDLEYAQSPVNDVLQRYYRRVIAQPRSALVGDLLLAVLLFLIVGYMGSSALAGTTGWAHFFAYLVFARVSLLAFKGLLVSMTGFARYYPHVRRIYEFLVSLKTSGNPGAVPLTVFSRGTDKIGDRKKLRVNPGEPVIVLTDVPLTRYNLYAFVDAIAGKEIAVNDLSGERSMCVSRGFSSLPGGTLNELMGISRTDKQAHIADRYDSVGLGNGSGEIDGDALISQPVWEAFSRQQRARLLLEQANNDKVQLVLTDAAVLIRSGLEYQQQWLSAMKDRIIAIVSDDVRMLNEFSCSDVVIMASDRSVSIADARWCLDNVDAINSWFERHLVQTETGNDEEFFEDE